VFGQLKVGHAAAADLDDTTRFAPIVESRASDGVCARDLRQKSVFRHAEHDHRIGFGRRNREHPLVRVRRLAPMNAHERVGADRLPRHVRRRFVHVPWPHVVNVREVSRIPRGFFTRRRRCDGTSTRRAARARFTSSTRCTARCARSRGAAGHGRILTARTCVSSTTPRRRGPSTPRSTRRAARSALAR
jgi:hypothetical protein